MRNRSKDQITIVLIRHGETKSNKEHRYLGRTDEELSNEGIIKLKELKNMNYYPEIDLLYSSPMKRCVQTASILYPSMQPIIVSDFKEIDFGIFEGKNHIELQKDERYQAWIDSNGTLPFPEGESKESFIQRCNKGFLKILEDINAFDNDKMPETVGMIVHGGTIMSILSSFYGGDYYDYQIENGKGFIMTVLNDHNKTKIVSLKRL